MVIYTTAEDNTPRHRWPLDLRCYFCMHSLGHSVQLHEYTLLPQDIARARWEVIIKSTTFYPHLAVFPRHLTINSYPHI